MVETKDPGRNDAYWPPGQPIEYPSQPATEPGELNIGLPNTTEDIRKLKSINGIPIDQLELRMRPYDQTKDFFTPVDPAPIPGAEEHLPRFSRSQYGFLGEKESLIEVLADDNDEIGAYGMTHQKVGRLLFDLMEAAGHGTTEFACLGNKIVHVAAGFPNGVQDSPFGDGVMVNAGALKFTNQTTGRTLSFDRLLPHLIYRYGFYEGHSTQYRLEPKTIMDFFGIKKKGKEPNS
ncbi:MAG: hypothetical protein Q7K39_01680 [Candidatus Magasanikbacteria bacterium]|nr:hypothetical protein [Candidatus Magasanikbacteria bacterium]